MIAKQQKKQNVFTFNQQCIQLDFNVLSNQIQNTIQCLIVLNYHFDDGWMKRAVKCAKNIILADGGANHFFYSQHKQSSKVRCIIGDLDSVKVEVLEYYQSRNVEVCKVQDQNSTDFYKAIMKAHEIGYKQIITVNALGGRIDHTFAALHLTSKICNMIQDMQIILIGVNNLMYFIRANLHYKLIISKDIQREGCGLITFERADMIQTTGFKWNLGINYPFHSLDWKQFISTSNMMEDEQITIKTSHPLFYTCSLLSQTF